MEQDDVYQNISINYSSPQGANDDPLEAVITVRNESQFDIPLHRTTCLINRVSRAGGGGFIGYVFQKVAHGWLQIDPNQPWQPEKEKCVQLRKGGDGQSDTCLNAIKQKPFSCADVTVRFEYVLDPKLNLVQVKEKRIKTFTVDGKSYTWYQVPLSSENSYCNE